MAHWEQETHEFCSLRSPGQEGNRSWTWWCCLKSQPLGGREESEELGVTLCFMTTVKALEHPDPPDFPHLSPVALQWAPCRRSALGGQPPLPGRNVLFVRSASLLRAARTPWRTTWTDISFSAPRTPSPLSDFTPPPSMWTHTHTHTSLSSCPFSVTLGSTVFCSYEPCLRPASVPGFLTPSSILIPLSQAGICLGSSG